MKNPLLEDFRVPVPPYKSMRPDIRLVATESEDSVTPPTPSILPKKRERVGRKKVIAEIRDQFGDAKRYILERLTPETQGEAREFIKRIKSLANQAELIINGAVAVGQVVKGTIQAGERLTANLGEILKANGQKPPEPASKPKPVPVPEPVVSPPIEPPKPANTPITPRTNQRTEQKDLTTAEELASIRAALSRPENQRNRHLIRTLLANKRILEKKIAGDRPSPTDVRPPQKVDSVPDAQVKKDNHGIESIDITKYSIGDMRRRLVEEKRGLVRARILLKTASDSGKEKIKKDIQRFEQNITVLEGGIKDSVESAKIVDKNQIGEGVAKPASGDVKKQKIQFYEDLNHAPMYERINDDAYDYELRHGGDEPYKPKPKGKSGDLSNAEIGDGLQEEIEEYTPKKPLSIKPNRHTNFPSEEIPVSPNTQSVQEPAPSAPFVPSGIPNRSEPIAPAGERITNLRDVSDQELENEIKRRKNGGYVGRTRALWEKIKVNVKGTYESLPQAVTMAFDESWTVRARKNIEMAETESNFHKGEKKRLEKLLADFEKKKKDPPIDSTPQKRREIAGSIVYIEDQIKKEEAAIMKFDMKSGEHKTKRDIWEDRRDRAVTRYAGRIDSVIDDFLRRRTALEEALKTEINPRKQQKIRESIDKINAVINPWKLKRDTAENAIKKPNKPNGQK